MQTKEDLERIALEYRLDKRRFEIPFSEFTYNGDYRILELMGTQICAFLQKAISVEFRCFLQYDSKNLYFCMVGGDSMISKFTVDIPYGDREQYISFITKVNSLVDEDGLVLLCVNNNPYALQFLVIIETHVNQDKIRDILKQYKLTADSSKGSLEVFTEMMNRKWNIAPLPASIMEAEKVEAIFSSIFLFATESQLNMRGIDCGANVQRKKIFISYCYADKAQVYSIVDAIEESGISAWIDKKQIDIGENILERVSQGIQECDVALLFLSRATKTSLFARHELNTFFNMEIYKASGKKWFLVKLDETNPNEIYPGLGNYLYFDYFNEPDVEELVGRLKKLMNK